MRYYLDEIEQTPISPCRSCEVGWGSYSSGVDEHGRKFYERKSCSDTCERLNQYIKTAINKRYKNTLSALLEVANGEQIYVEGRNSKGD